jgi:hypothetical protein
VDIWQRERTLARTTVAWGMASVVAGSGIAATTRDPWRRSYALQTAGWGAVDLGIAALGVRLQDRRMRRLPDPFATAAQEDERVKLRRVLLVNVAADVGYVALGARLARDSRPRLAGAGVAILLQGAFLLLHDSVHAVGARPSHLVPAMAKFHVAINL